MKRTCEFHPAERLIKEGKYNQMEVSNSYNYFRIKHFECQICKGNLEKKFKNSLEIKNNPLSLHPLSARFFSRLMRVKKIKEKFAEIKIHIIFATPIQQKTFSEKK